MGHLSFSEMLVNRRRQLGLTTAQASRVLKLKEQVLIAFEEGDFEHMPQSGYAQGMLSSYARYLGLNPREITDLFQEEFYEHRHGTTSHELRRRTRETQSGRGLAGYDVVNEEGSRPKAYVEYHGLLPTAGGPAGDMGAFATTSLPTGRQTGSVPLAGSRQTQGSAYSHSAYVSGHPYNRQRPDSRGVSQSTQRMRPQQTRRRPDQDGTRRLLSEGQSNRSGAGSRDGGRSSVRSQRLYRRDDISRRDVSRDDFTDDLRYDAASQYERASTISGRRSSRNIASVDRPNVRRRSAGEDRRYRRRQPRKTGFAGAVEAVFSDTRTLALLIVLALAIILTVVIVTSVSSCVSNRVNPTTAQPSTVSVTDPVDKDSSSSADSGAGEDQGTSATEDGTGDASTSSSASASASDAEDQTPKETKVRVSLASGQVAWVEIDCDGQSVVAETITGPWNKTFTVTDQITVQVSDTEAVTVTENGTKVEFDSMASGIGSVTIKGTPAAESDGASSSDTSTSAVSEDGDTDTGQE